jgi:hypothetical protein
VPDKSAPDSSSPASLQALSDLSTPSTTGRTTEPSRSCTLRQGGLPPGRVVIVGGVSLAGLPWRPSGVAWHTRRDDPTHTAAATAGQPRTQ